jgi:NTE family protein
MLRRLIPLCLLVIATALLGPATATADPPAPPDRPKVALVLSGGGARGAAHIGIIKRFEELHIPIDIITGTSMGAIVGGIYAAGVPISEVEDWMRTTDWASLLNDRPDRAQRSIRNKNDDYNYPRGLEFGLNGSRLKLPPTLVTGQKFIFELRQLTLPALDITDFDQLPIPFRAIATDILTGDSIVLDRGSLPEAIRASMAIPGLFAPVKRDGMVLVDGFLRNNLPIDIAQQMGADIIIAVNVKAALVSEDELRSPVAYSTQMLNVMGLAQDKHQISLLHENDIYIYILMPGQKPGDFPSAPDNIAAGYTAAREHDARLAALSLSPADYLAWNENRLAPSPAHLVIEDIQMAGNSRVSSRSLHRKLGLAPGEPLSLPRLQQGLGQIYDTGEFELVDFNLLPTADPDRRILELQPNDKTWGPNYLRFGLVLASDLESVSSFNILTDYRMTQLNDLGAEFTFEANVGDGQYYGAEFYQPLDYASRFFVAPTIGYDHQTSLESNQNLSISGFSYGSLLGLNLGPQALLSVSISHHDTNISGFLPQSISYTEDILSLEFSWDTIDNIYFPKYGLSLNLGVNQNKGTFSDGLGDIVNKNFTAQVLWPLTYGTSTLLTYIDIAGPINENRASQITHTGLTLGGLFNLSGVPLDSISGDTAMIGRLVYYHHFAKFSPLIGEGVYLGGSLEAGNAWTDGSYDLSDLIYAGSVFIGLDTFVGPLYIAYGRANTNEGSMYFYLGQTF